MSILWRGDSISRYHQLLTPTQGKRVGFVSAPAFRTGRSCRMELRKGDTAGKNSAYPNSVSSDGACRNQFRGIVYGNRLFNEKEERFFRFGLMIDPSMTIGGSFSNPWRSLLSFPSVEDGRFSPLKLMLQRERNGGANPSGTDALTISGDLGVAGAYDVTQWRLPNPIKGRWYEFVFRLVFSSDAQKGLFEFWMMEPGKQAFAKQSFNAGALNGRSTATLRTLSAPGHRANLRQGIYRNKVFTTTDVLYYGGVLMADSLNSALAG